MATKSPASLIVFGVLNILWGLVGFCGTLFSLVFVVWDLIDLPETLDLQAVLEERYDWYGTYTAVTITLGGVVSLILIAAGVGLFRLREWARKATIAYGIYGVVSAVVGTWLIMGYMLPVVEELMDTADEFERATLRGTQWGVYGAMITIIYPVLVLIFMNRSVLKNAIAEAEQARAHTDE